MDTEEKFDRVDVNDKVIGTTTKNEAHDKGYVHRIVAVYVFNKNGELYLQRKGKRQFLDHSIGGHVLAGESYDEAAKRESFEELRLNQQFSYIGKLYSDEIHRHPNHRHIYSIYKTEVPNGWQLDPTEEVKQLELMEIDKIVSLMDTNPELFTAGFINTFKLVHPQKSDR
ncbi:MAG: NUDIX domain-containing protein [Candidatus Saccharimonadales bacterium]